MHKNYFTNFIKNYGPSLSNEIYRIIQKLTLYLQRNIILYAPIFYASGVLLYFSLDYEPYWQSTLIILSILFSLITLARYLVVKNKYIFQANLAFYFLLIIFITGCGFLGANLRTLVVEAPVIERQTRVINLTAVIELIEPHQKHYRITLNNLKIDNFTADDTPKKIRLSNFKNQNYVRTGDMIALRAMLLPVPKMVLPESYNFARDFYFKQIGALGTVIGNAKIIVPNKMSNLEIITANIRRLISDKISLKMSDPAASIAKALFVGEMSGLNEADMSVVRDSGLAHLLSISGLHMALVSAIMFFIIRSLLAMIPAIALAHDTKKVAAGFAIAASYFYLLLSGYQVAALRSFIMVALILLAIILNRFVSPLRILAFAALYILLLTPENILNPGFQMSFMSVLVLIAAFNKIAPVINDFAIKNRLPKITTHIVNIVISSVLATLATLFIGIYHFKRIAVLGFLANLLAIPISSFLVMPIGIIMLLLMPLNLDYWPAFLLQKSIDLIMYIAKTVAGLPYAAISAKPISDLQFLAIITGILIICLFSNNKRYLGLVFIILSIFSMQFNNLPDIIIDTNAKSLAIQDLEGKLWFVGKKPKKIVKKEWLKYFAQEQELIFNEIANDQNENINTLQNNLNCDSASCILEKNGHKIAFVKQPIALMRDCNWANVIINLTRVKFSAQTSISSTQKQSLNTKRQYSYEKIYCPNLLRQIDSSQLKNQGTHELYLGKDLLIKTASGGKYRPWGW